MTAALDVIADRGRIVAEFFDVGFSRTVPWARRRQAARLLQAVANPQRGFDAIIVGESERAFTGTQLLHLAPVFLAHGVQVWLPELDGPVDLADPAHQELIMRLGERARRAVARARHRTTTAMRAQARDQGRYLGGRLPYGYRLVDAGPHPNAAHAAWGRRLQRLDLDPTTADTVRWIFAQRMVGGSLAGIARDLNDRGVPCPSEADRRRNRHRHGGVWTVQAVQAIRATRASSDAAPRTYRLAGLLQCGICGRRLDSRWVNNRPGYRCRHGHTSANSATAHEDRERAVYLREDELLHDLATALHRGSGRPPTPEEVPGLLRARKITIICTRTQRTLARHHGGTPPPMG